jgi:hypothetical protein
MHRKETALNGTLSRYYPTTTLQIDLSYADYFRIYDKKSWDPLSTDHGTPGDEITMPGRFFSTRKGKVYIEYEENGQIRKKSCTVK